MNLILSSVGDILRIPVFISIMIILFNQNVLSCPISGKSISKSEKANLQKELLSLKRKHRLPSESKFVLNLPDSASTTPWGGQNSQNWRPEAILANAVSHALNLAWKESNLIDAVIAVPVQLTFTNNRVYCDGQTNAALNFGEWTKKEPQLVASLFKYTDGSRKIKFLLSKDLILKEHKLAIISFLSKPDGLKRKVTDTVELNLRTEGYVGTWSPSANLVFGDLVSNHVFWVKPNGWTDVFPLDFRMTILKSSELLDSSAVKTIGKSQSLLDPLAIQSKSKTNQKLSIEQLLNTTFDKEWDQFDKGPYEPSNIHAEIDWNSKKFFTATGKGWTWVSNKNAKENVPFKNLYTCFDKRNFSSESDLGVPSGGGWHEIGDAAETIINNLESSPIIVGTASSVMEQTPPDSAGFAWQLKNIAVVRLLQPNEALLTPAGSQTWQEDSTFRIEKEKNPNACNNDTRAKGDGSGRNYHWFIFHNDVPVCTQEWVHNCVPNGKNSWGLNCTN